MVTGEPRPLPRSLRSPTGFGRLTLTAVSRCRFGYSSTFLLTALLQATGMLTHFLLLPLVPRKEGSGVAPAAADAEGGSATEPLLNPQEREAAEAASLADATA